MHKNIKGFTLVEVMIVTGIVSLLSAIAVPNLLSAKISANHAAAQAALKTISTSLENYAGINTVYPTNYNDLLTAVPPYLTTDYFVGTHNGYNFTPTLNPYTYTITATPAASQQGTSTFTITTGGVLSAN